MRQQEQWTAYIDENSNCQVTRVTEMRGLPEDHYDYEEPIFLPTDSIKVILQNPTADAWRQTLKRYLEINHPDLRDHQLLKVPRDPWDERKLVDDPAAILKANLEVKPGAIPEIGNVVDETFEIERRLGNGAAGTAFEVKLTRDWNGLSKGSSLCLKWYNDDIFKKEPEPTAIARRVRESTVGGSLCHPNLVRVYSTIDFWKDGKPRYLLMNLIGGETLEELIKRGPVPSERANQQIIDIANGLKALHDAEILHRDVKTANVMVNTGGRAVLLDLGVVRPVSAATMTDTQGFLGTLRFAAPEWLFAEECTAASDIYSLGTILYHLLTGHEIFCEHTLFSRLVVAAKNEDPVLVDAGWDARRRYLANLARRMLAKTSTNRPTFSELIEALSNERRFEVWSGLERGAIFRRMPTHYQADGESQRAFVNAVLERVAPSEFRDIVAGSDYDRLMKHEHIREIFNLETIGNGIEDYLDLPPEYRVEWAKNALARIANENKLKLGVQIEASCLLMNRVYAAEPLEEVRIKLKPVVEETEIAMSQMMQDLAQENP
jgi:serine/threonine protein kinase